MSFQNILANKDHTSIKSSLIEYSKPEIEALLLLLSALIISSAMQEEVTEQEEQELNTFVESLNSEKKNLPQDEASRLLRKTVVFLNLKQYQGSLTGIAHQKFNQVITGLFYKIYNQE